MRGTLGRPRGRGFGVAASGAPVRMDGTERDMGGGAATGPPGRRASDQPPLLTPCATCPAGTCGAAFST